MRTTATADRYLSLGEVAEVLGTSTQWVRRRVKSGELPAYKPGKEWRIRESDLNEFLETHSYPKVQAPLLPAEEEERRLSFFADAIITAADKWISIIADPDMSDERRFGIADAASALGDYAEEYVDEQLWNTLSNAERRELIGVQERLLEVVRQVNQHVGDQQLEEEFAERREKIREWTRQISA